MADGVGQTLRAAREAQGLDLAEVARRTRVPTRHLTAIEEGDHGTLPAATYSAGFVKGYARLLGLDGQALSQEFRAELAHRAPAPALHEPYEPVDPARTPSRLLVWVTLALALLVVLGYLYWRGTRSATNPAELAASGSDRTAPVARPQAAPAQVRQIAPAAQPVTLLAQEAAWMRIYEMAGGARLFEGVLQPGQSYVVPATAADPRLLTSRPEVLKVTVGASAIPTLGKPAQRIKDVSLKPQALLGRLGQGEPAAASPVPATPGAATPVENGAGPE